MEVDADLDGQWQGGATGGAIAVTEMVQGRPRLLAGKVACMMSYWDMDDLFMDSTGDFLFPHPQYYMDNIPE
jgi:hypothetical protein